MIAYVKIAETTSFSPSEQPEFDNGQAGSEGWGIFECSGSDNGIFQLCRCDEEAKFDSDDGAWLHVVKQARDGSAYHRAALDYIRAQNPLEWISFASTHGETLTYPTGSAMLDGDRLMLNEAGAIVVDDNSRRYRLDESGNWEKRR